MPSFLCYDYHTNAFYGIQRFTGKRGCHLVRLSPYNGSIDILSEDFNDYEPSAGDCYDGYYFTMVILNIETQKIVLPRARKQSLCGKKNILILRVWRTS